MHIRVDDEALLVVEEHGPTSAPGVPLVLLHGLSQQRRYWQPVVNRLPDRRIITVDQRGHGDAAVSEVTEQTDFSMRRLALDVEVVLDEMGIDEAIVVGHSWGASVALHAAAILPSRVRSAVLLDGGLFGPRHLVSADLDADQVREALRPPPLGLLAPALWQAISSGDLSPYWTTEVQEALDPTFWVDSSGRAFTRIGPDRHMAVLDGLIEYDPAPDVAAVSCPVWAVSCEPRLDEREDDDPITRAWLRARGEQLASLPRTFFLQRWTGALHDVPLQWPALVAGLLETVAERTEPREEPSPGGVSE